MIPALIGAGASLLGGLFNKSSADDNRAAQERMAAQNIAQQREFAQHGIRWKVDDARAAGIHPLFALGANTTSFSPVSVGSSADTSMGDAIASAGQNIGRAVQAGQTRAERSTSAIADALILEKAGLENELLRTQIMQLKNPPGHPPAMPTLGPSPAGFPVKTDDIKQTPDDMPETARIRPGGLSLKTNPYFSDAEKVENRYSNVVENVAGAVNLLADMGYTVWHSGVKVGLPRSRGKSPFSRSYERR